MPPRAVTYDESGAPIPFERKLKDGGPLHRLLLKSCPPDPETGAKSITILAKAVGVSRQALDQAIRRGEINVKLAAKIVDVADGRATLSDFAPFYLL